MTTLGLCTHFQPTDDWAFDFALDLAKRRDWQLNICHWLHSPYRIRRDMVPDDLFHPNQTLPITPHLQARLELQLREYYDQKLGDFTNVAFKLCEGHYQVELARCFRKNLLDLVMMGFQAAELEEESGAEALEAFAAKLPHPLILVGKDGPGTFLLNEIAVGWLELLELPQGSWQVLHTAGIPARQA